MTLRRFGRFPSVARAVSASASRVWCLPAEAAGASPSPTSAAAPAVQRRRYASMEREVVKGGFAPTLGVSTLPIELEPTASSRYVVDLAARGENVLITGPAGTGKLTLLTHVGKALEGRHGKKVAWTSMRSTNANHMPGGLNLMMFLGFKPFQEIVSADQVEAAMARHVRLMREQFEDTLPTLESVDVLVVDSLELTSPIVFAALDKICREVRGERLDAALAGRPFGGLQVVASANFWRMAVSPSSLFTGYIYQLPEFSSMFPEANQMLLQHFFRHKDAAFSTATLKALYGKLGEDGMPAELARPLTGTGVVDLVDNARGAYGWFPAFPKQTCRDVRPDASKSLRFTQFGTWFTNVLSSTGTARSFSLCASLDLSVGDTVCFAYDMEGLFAAGDTAVVTLVSDNSIRVATEQRSAIDVSRMRVQTRHPSFPAIEISTEQFPLYKAAAIHPNGIINLVRRAPKCNINCLLLTDTNDLGNIMAASGGPGTMAFQDAAAYVTRGETVHEATRNYYEHLMAQPQYDRAPSVAAGLHEEQSEAWCRNCKAHIPAADFYAHWTACIQAVQWCSDCGRTIPQAKWEAHNEKHTIVMCIDCGRALEWKHWDQHRLTCGAMIREVTAENPMLPNKTQEAALSSGFDRSDIHTVKGITKSTLPRQAAKVTGAHRRAFRY
jgi:hypothetical protein